MHAIQKLSLLTLVSITLMAAAHIEPGLYRGADDAGAACTMTVVEQFYENDNPHPLTERVRVKVADVEYVVGHPSVLKSEENLVSFNHDFFQQIQPTATGARALIITMVESADGHGPGSYQTIDNTWRGDVRKSAQCRDLKFVE